MQQIVETVDGDLTQPVMNEHGKYSATMAARFFVSWSEAKKRLENGKRGSVEILYVRHHYWNNR
jgi:hypothetical protein